MQDITVNTAKLLEIVKVNRRKHQEEYDIAHKAYLELVIYDLEQRLINARTKGEIDLSFRHLVPMCHTSEYDTVIRMLQLSIDLNTVLTEHDFKMYVMDEWHWKNDFQLSSNYCISGIRNL